MTDERDDERSGEDESRAVRALDAAERADPPPGLAGAVMRAVRAHAAPGRQLPAGWRVFKGRDSGLPSPGFWRHDSIRGGIMSTSKKVLLGVAAAAVIAIGYFAIKGYPPVGDGAAGTVGAAKKFQSEQISDKDVILQDAEVQQVLQSDAFRRVVADKETRAILASKEFQKAMSNANVLAVLQQLAADKALAGALLSASHNEATQKLWAGAASDSAVQLAMGQALDSAGVQKALDLARSDKAVNEAAGRAAANEAAGRAASDAAGRASSEASSRASNEALTQALTQATGRDSAAGNLLSNAARSEAFVALLQNASFQRALNDASFVKLLGNGSFVGLITSDAFNGAFASKAIRDAAANGVLVQALNSAATNAATSAARDAASSSAKGDQAR
jgi:hypothetical protein